MVLTLYHLDASPPCRAIRWLASALELDLELKTVDLVAGEHLQPEFRQKTPAHQVPLLEDNGIFLSESRAILGYLVDKYAKDDSLYPKDALKRAIVNQRLHFDLGTLWQRYSDYYLPYHMYDKEDNEKLVKLDDAFSVLDEVMKNQKYAAGNNITIADYALAVTVSSAEFSGYKVDAYSNVKRWLDIVSKEIPTFNEVNTQSFESLRKLYEIVRSKH